MAWFLFPQIDQRTVKNKANSSVKPESMNLETESIIDAFGDEKLTGQSGQLTQVSLAWEQRNKECWTDSISLSHNGQKPEIFRPRLRRFSMVGRPFLQTLQAKIRIFGGY